METEEEMRKIQKSEQKGRDETNESREMKDARGEKETRGREVLAEWTAKEYVVQEKSGKWFFGVVMATLTLVALAVWWQYWSFAVLVVVASVALVVYVRRPAREITYKLDKEGLYEGEKLYRYGDFKSFAVVRERNNFLIVLVPKKRIAITVRVYFPQEQGEKIVDIFGMRLPMEALEMDLLDKVAKFLRI